jgi:hypothetical protein
MITFNLDFNLEFNGSLSSVIRNNSSGKVGPEVLGHP